MFVALAALLGTAKVGSSSETLLTTLSDAHVRAPWVGFDAGQSRR